MLLPRLTPAQTIEIWSPRYNDRTVMIAAYKVGTHNIITFTKAKSMPGQYYLSGETIRKYPQETNGKLMCHAVPLDELVVFEGRSEN